jgi:tryptophanyl-tRNA synthetase
MPPLRRSRSVKSDQRGSATSTRVLSGIQPSGPLHLGNYFGMIRPAVALQTQGEAFYFVADLHALTTVRAPADLRRWSREVALDLLAAGLDPARAVLFRQSDVPEVTALAWILSAVTPVGLLERAHAYKDKVARGLQASHGLFAYPVLMAADILLYDADLVPVGRDQMQHVEITRDIAGKLNDAYGPVFRLPRASILNDAAVVPGTDGQKMSKSYRNTIELGLVGDALRKRVMEIVTDSASMADPKDPSGSTILALYRLVASEAEVRQMEQEFRAGRVGYSTFKRRLFETLEAYFAPFRARRDALAREPGAVDRLLQNGAEQARTLAAQTMARVRLAVGIE